MSAVHRRPHHVHDDVDREEAAILERLRADGGRVTTGRRAVVRALLTGDDHHVTAEDVVHAVAAEHPDVHLSTVYRTLEALEALGIVDRVTLGAGGAIWHLTDHVHHHLLCSACGSVTEVPADLFGALARRLDRHCGFALPTRHLAVTGRCADCRSGGSATT